MIETIRFKLSSTLIGLGLWLIPDDFVKYTISCYLNAAADEIKETLGDETRTLQ